MKHTHPAESDCDWCPLCSAATNRRRLLPRRRSHRRPSQSICCAILVVCCAAHRDRRAADRLRRLRASDASEWRATRRPDHCTMRCEKHSWFGNVMFWLKIYNSNNNLPNLFKCSKDSDTVSERKKRSLLMQSPCYLHYTLFRKKSPAWNLPAENWSADQQFNLDLVLHNDAQVFPLWRISDSIWRNRNCNLAFLLSPLWQTRNRSKYDTTWYWF